MNWNCGRVYHRSLKFANYHANLRYRPLQTLSAPLKRATVMGYTAAISTAPFVLVTEHLVVVVTRLRLPPTVHVAHPRGKSILIYFILFVNTRLCWPLGRRKTMFCVSISSKNGVDFVNKIDAMSY